MLRPLRNKIELCESLLELCFIEKALIKSINKSSIATRAAHDKGGTTTKSEGGRLVSLLEWVNEVCVSPAKLVLT
jgi:hypothetical protein